MEGFVRPGGAERLFGVFLIGRRQCGLIAVIGCLGAGGLAGFGCFTAPDVAAACGRLAVPAAPRTAVSLVVGGARGALFLVDQRLPVGDRDLVVIRVDFAERQEAVAIAAVVDESGLQRRLDARHLRQIDIAA